VSNLILNFRFAYWHLQASRDRPWVWVSFNPYRWRKGAWRPLAQFY
jgi:hypothetical protein